MAATISLAGRSIALMIPPLYQAVLFPVFHPFTVSKSETFDAVFSVDCTENEVPLEGATARGAIFFREEDSDTFSILDPRFCMRVSLREKCAKLRVRQKYDKSGAIVYSALKWFMSFLVIYEGGLPIHSSMIRFNGNGLLFCGPSGSGKSTICTLLAEGLPGEAARGSDEVNCIFSVLSKLTVYPTPYFSSAGISTVTESAPIEKIFFLEHANSHRLEKLSGNAAFRHLLRNVYHVGSNKLITECMLDTIGKITAAGSFNVLYFKNDISIARFLKLQAGIQHEIAAKPGIVYTENRH